jgi:hypothetical protein
VKVFAEKPLPPGSGATEVYSCKFRKQKYIFVKNEIEKYKNKKTAHYHWVIWASASACCLIIGPSISHHIQTTYLGALIKQESIEQPAPFLSTFSCFMTPFRSPG